MNLYTNLVKKYLTPILILRYLISHKVAQIASKNCAMLFYIKSWDWFEALQRLSIYVSLYKNDGRGIKSVFVIEHCS